MDGRTTSKCLEVAQPPPKLMGWLTRPGRYLGVNRPSKELMGWLGHPQIKQGG